MDKVVAAGIDDHTQLGIIDPGECVRLLESTPIGRVVFVAEGQPLAMPVNFRWFQDSVVFRTLEGQKLYAATLKQPVAFEVDDWDPATKQGWSVIVKGIGYEVTGWAEEEQLEQLGLVPWSHGKWRPKWMRITPTEVTGRVI